MTKLFSLILLFTICISNAQEYVDITHYGATTHLEDNSEAIQKAIDENPNKIIYFPSSLGPLDTGFFRVTKPILINHPVVIKGAGRQNTRFQPVNCNGFIIQSSYVTIEDMHIFGSSSDGGNYTGIYCELENISDGEDRLSNLHFESLILQDWVVGIELRNTWSCTLNKIRTAPTTKMSQGIRFFGQCVNNHISDCHINALGQAIAIIRENPDGLHPLDNTKTKRAEGLMITNSFISGNNAIYSEGILNMNISNCVIDLNKEIAIQGFHTDHLKLSNNWIAVYINNPVQHPAIKLMSSIYGNISNNTIVFTNNLALTTEELNLINNKVGISFEYSSGANIVTGNSFVDVDYKVLVRSGGGNIIKDNTPIE